MGQGEGNQEGVLSSQGLETWGCPITMSGPPGVQEESPVGAGALGR